MDTIECRVGNKIKQLRIKRKLSQEELAFNCGLSKNYICDVENGKRNISIKSVAKIAKGLRVKEKDLFL